MQNVCAIDNDWHYARLGLDIFRRSGLHLRERANGDFYAFVMHPRKSFSGSVVACNECFAP
jgi:hypothetical protein